MRRTTAALAAIVLVLAAACGDDTTTGPGPDVRRFSFESGLGNWSADATDLEVGGEPIEWDIAASDDAATEGSSAVRLSLENLSDAGKIWIERPFELEPQTTYDVTVAFDFGTTDFGAVNLWTIIAGVFPVSPETTDDLQPAFQGETGHDEGQGAGLVWLAKEYDFTATTGPDGTLHVALGVWGTYEVSRIYYLDDVRISFTPAG